MLHKIPYEFIGGNTMYYRGSDACPSTKEFLLPPSVKKRYPF